MINQYINRESFLGYLSCESAYYDGNDAMIRTLVSEFNKARQNHVYNGIIAQAFQPHTFGIALREVKAVSAMSRINPVFRWYARTLGESGGYILFADANIRAQVTGSNVRYTTVDPTILIDNWSGKVNMPVNAGGYNLAQILSSNFVLPSLSSHSSELMVSYDKMFSDFKIREGRFQRAVAGVRYWLAGNKDIDDYGHAYGLSGLWAHLMGFGLGNVAGLATLLSTTGASKVRNPAACIVKQFFSTYARYNRALVRMRDGEVFNTLMRHGDDLVILPAAFSPAYYSDGRSIVIVKSGSFTTIELDIADASLLSDRSEFGKLYANKQVSLGSMFSNATLIDCAGGVSTSTTTNAGVARSPKPTGKSTVSNLASHFEKYTFEPGLAEELSGPEFSGKTMLVNLLTL